ncbi:MAG: 3'(2'),5'-bisphosphate nucleotidase CysQ [Pseudomonadota bacterium]|nr:3'(2'),5'-bisphosphate nucleotidase CysQ [Pseudomonadota bacterium]
MVDLNKLLPDVIHIAERAGDEILRIYTQETVRVTTKMDTTPVTQADVAAHDIIVAALRALTPTIPVISEEDVLPPFVERKTWSYYWLVDPLDGTKDFIAHTDGFSVNIALIEGNDAILGVIVSPTEQTCYYAARGLGAYCKPRGGVAKAIRTRLWPDDLNLIVVVSRLHSDQRLAKFMVDMGDYEVMSMGSARKFCMIAEGVADFYPRTGRTCEWDTAAGQCLIKEAGGAVVDAEGKPLRYNTKDDVFNPTFMVTGDLVSLQKRFNFFKNEV